MLHILLAATLALAAPLGAQAAALTDAPLVDAGWLAQRLGAEALVVIDVRDPTSDTGAMTPGHVPGAVHAPYSTHGWRAEVDGVPGMLPQLDAIAATIGRLGVDADSHVVIVAQGADSTEFGAATRVYWTLKVLGHDAVSILDGGQNAWIDAGGATVPAPAAPSPAVFTAAFRPDLLATADDVAAAIAGPAALVDGRPEAQFTGAEKPAAARVAGTIPTAVNIPHSRLYDGDFVTPEEMAALRAAVGLDAAQPTIAFCNTGHWASIAWFGLSEVGGGAEAAMYDGSMADWTQDARRPVVVAP
jgi:thiosulfate/3-mercaptopyruvate sulfurtransferase